MPLNSIPESETRTLYINQYDNELETLCDKLNAAYIAYTGYKERYAEIMDYFRVQLHRGFITKEQYSERAKMFAGYNENRGKKQAVK